jgi:hypothetical protein
MSVFRCFFIFIWISLLSLTPAVSGTWHNKTKLPIDVQNESFENIARINLNETLNKNQNEKVSKSLKWPPQRKPSRHKIQEKQFLLTRPRRPTFPFRLTPAALLIPAIPTLVGKRWFLKYFSFCIFISGLGAGLAWVASQRRPITTTFSNIGSPTTNVTVSETNTNTPTVTQTQTSTNTQTNTNNDDDTISSSSTNTNTNTNTNTDTNCVCTCTNNVCTCNCG